MDKEYEVSLQEKFFFMIPTEESKAKCYRCCECGNGWYQLLHDMCQEITDIYAQNNKEIDLVVGQVKEKFSTLRFYYGFKTKSNEVDEETKILRKDIKSIVDKYESKSGKICEECGAPGKLRDDFYWIQTLCDSCAEKRNRNKRDIK